MKKNINVLPSKASNSILCQLENKLDIKINKDNVMLINLLHDKDEKAVNMTSVYRNLVNIDGFYVHTLCLLNKHLLKVIQEDTDVSSTKLEQTERELIFTVTRNELFNYIEPIINLSSDEYLFKLLNKISNIAVYVQNLELSKEKDKTVYNIVRPFRITPIEAEAHKNNNFITHTLFEIALSKIISINFLNCLSSAKLKNNNDLIGDNFITFHEKLYNLLKLIIVDDVILNFYFSLYLKSFSLNTFNNDYIELSKKEFLKLLPNSSKSINNNKYIKLCDKAKIDDYINELPDIFNNIHDILCSNREYAYIFKQDKKLLYNIQHMNKDNYKLYYKPINN